MWKPGIMEKYRRRGCLAVGLTRFIWLRRLSPCGRAILTNAMVGTPIYVLFLHNREYGAEISSWCHLSFLGDTQNSLRDGLQSEERAGVDTCGVGIFGV